MEMTPQLPLETNHRETRHRGWIAAWLYLVCLTIFAMVVVGGITRLTHSGLSMVEWRPLLGVFPPTNETEWNATFEKYKQYPEYRQRGEEMTLGEFKFIFYWEYFHRLLGRIVGVVFLVPFLGFWLRGWLNRALVWKLLAAFVLGGLQGLLGWFMVKSGLVDVPRVSHYRLAAHLALALFLMSYLFWLALNLTFPAGDPAERRFPGLHKFSLIITLIVTVQIIYGAFMAGLHAGLLFNTFPTMNGQWIPAGIGKLEPRWLNLFENPVAVQFIHRGLAWILFITIPVFFVAAGKRDLTARQRASTGCLVGVLLVQFLLGVLTLINAVPLALASLHQAGACLLLLAALFANHSFKNG